MSEHDHFERPLDPFSTGDEWEPWNSVAYCLPTFQTPDGRVFATPFYVYARSVDRAKKTVMIHLGVSLQSQGIEADWIRSLS